MAEELRRAGVEAHLAEPADTATRRGKKKRAKTDRTDARLARELLADQRLPESWIPPEHVLEVRTLGRLYVSFMEERRAWQQRIHAQLHHQGAAPIGRGLLTERGRAAIAATELSGRADTRSESSLLVGSTTRASTSCRNVSSPPAPRRVPSAS